MRSRADLYREFWGEVIDVYHQHGSSKAEKTKLQEKFPGIPLGTIDSALAFCGAKDK